MGPGDMKSLIVEEMSILWSAIGREALKRSQENTYFSGNISCLNTCLIFTSVYACGCVVPLEARGIQSPRAGVMSSCVLPDEGAGN